jgi:hypothetical protein
VAVPTEGGDTEVVTESTDEPDDPSGETDQA